MMIPGSIAPPLSLPPVTIVSFEPYTPARRPYFTSNNPDYIDTPGVNWGGNALASQGWLAQMMLSLLTGTGGQTFEVNVGQVRTYQMFIGGVYAGIQAVVGAGGNNAGIWVTISDALSGAITFKDNITDDESAYTGLIQVAARYSRV